MTTTANLRTIAQISERAVALYQKLDMLEERNVKFARIAIASEVTIVHREIMPLRLDELLATDDSNFVHDIAGIHRHLDYGGSSTSPSLTGCFVPRFANV